MNSSNCIWLALAVVGFAASCGSDSTRSQPSGSSTGGADTGGSSVGGRPNAGGTGGRATGGAGGSLPIGQTCADVCDLLTTTDLTCVPSPCVETCVEKYDLLAAENSLCSNAYFNLLVCGVSKPASSWVCYPLGSLTIPAPPQAAAPDGCDTEMRALQSVLIMYINTCVAALQRDAGAAGGAGAGGAGEGGAGVGGASEGGAGVGGASEGGASAGGASEGGAGEGGAGVGGAGEGGAGEGGAGEGGAGEGGAGG